MRIRAFSNAQRSRKGFGLVLVFIAGAYQLFCVFQPLEFLSQYVVVLDDAYYYFQIARNVALYGWATFDRIHAVSGIQLLWGLVLSAVAVVVNGRMEFLHATLVLCVVLNITAGILVWRLGRRLSDGLLGEVAALIWGGFMLGLVPTLMGMEYSLHIVIIILTITLWWDVLEGSPSISLPQLLILGILLTLNYWTRLDSAVYSLLILISVGIVLWRTSSSWLGYLGKLSVLSLVPALGAVGYAATSYLLAGTFLPISGSVKAYYAAHHFDQYSWVTWLGGHALWWLEIQSRPLLDIVSSILLGGSSFTPLKLMVLALIAGVSLWSIRQIRHEGVSHPDRYRVSKFLGLLILFGAFHVAVVVLTIGHFAHITQHYWGWLLVTWCLWGALMVELILSRLPQGSTRRFASALALATFLAVHLWLSVDRLVEEIKPNLNNERVNTVAWINANLPANARIGAWNAGLLGYFVDRTVVNLDGLANDRQYLAFLQSGLPVQQYLRREHITYLVDVDLPDLTMPYQASWDHSRLFRNSIPWNDLQIFYRDASQGSLFVLQLRSDATAP